MKKMTLWHTLLGLAKTFYTAYNELNEKDFFDIASEDINTFNLAVLTA